MTAQPTDLPAVPTLALPRGFAWGAGTSSYQIEGAVDADGKGPSIWDTFTGEPGRIVGGDTGEQACDHFHRYPEDFDLAAELGVDTYRFSLSWPRIMPTGSGRVEPRGLAFYDRLVDGLLARGIRPAKATTARPSSRSPNRAPAGTPAGRAAGSGDPARTRRWRARP